MYLLNIYKKAYSGLSTESWYLSLVVLVNRSGSMVIPFMAIYCIQEQHFTLTQTGTLITFFGLGSLCGAFTGGRLVDKLGFYNIQLFSLTSAGIFFIILGYLSTYVELCMCAFAVSFFNDMFRPANSTAINHFSTRQNKIRSFSLNRLAVNLGWACGAAVGGLVASYNYHLLFWIDGCTNIASGILLSQILKNPKENGTQHSAIKASVERLPYKDGRYVLFLLCTLIFGTCMFQTFTIQPIFFKTQWHFKESLIGALMALNGLIIAVFEMLLCHFLEGKVNPLRCVFWGCIISGFFLASVNFFYPSVIAAAAIIVGITIGQMLVLPSMNLFWVQRSGINNSGQYAAFYAMTWSGAQIMSPVIGSRVIQSSGFQTLWWLTGITCCIISGIFYLLDCFGAKRNKI